MAEKNPFSKLLAHEISGLDKQISDYHRYVEAQGATTKRTIFYRKMIREKLVTKNQLLAAETNPVIEQELFSTELKKQIAVCEYLPEKYQNFETFFAAIKDNFVGDNPGKDYTEEQLLWDIESQLELPDPFKGEPLLFQDLPFSEKIAVALRMFLQSVPVDGETEEIVEMEVLAADIKPPEALRITDVHSLVKQEVRQQIEHTNVQPYPSTIFKEGPSSKKKAPKLLIQKHYLPLERLAKVEVEWVEVDRWMIEEVGEVVSAEEMLKLFATVLEWEKENNASVNMSGVIENL